MNNITILGMDPALRNFGLALVDVNIDTKAMTPIELRLIKTERDKTKTVRHSSSQLRRAEEIAVVVRDFEQRASMAAAEIPSGAQSSAAAYGFGVAVGVIGGHTIPLIEVSAREAKLSAVEKPTASKQEMIDWAYERWPDLNWLKSRGKLINDNEHLADALAIVKAATETAQFDQAVALMRATLKTAAE